jgi:hypothetical protein
MCEKIGDWRTLINEVLHNLYISANVIRMMKPRRMRWAGYLSRIGRRGMHTGFWWDIQNETDHQEDVNVCGRIILQEVRGRTNRLLSFCHIICI